MPMPPKPPERGRHWEEPTHGEIMDALTELSERLDRIERKLER